MKRTSVFTNLINKSTTILSNIQDTRQESNAKKYSMESAGIGCLSVFMMQEPSFLSHQKRLGKKTNTSNFETLFGIKKIPSPNQIRNILDNASPKELHGLYDEGLNLLIDKGAIKSFEFMNHHLIALDGVDYHSSQKISCANCSTKNSNGNITYSHSMLAASIVSPNLKEAIALHPEFITPQDGHEKQDCENAAAKRWLEKNGKYYQKLRPIYLGDDLYSNESICTAVLKQKAHFICLQARFS